MNTKKVSLIMGVGYAIFMIALMLILGVNNTFGQTIIEESTAAFRYDNVNPLDAPTIVPTVEQLKDAAIDRKMEKYNPQGLPSIENVKKNPINVVIGILLPKMPKLGSVKDDVSLFLVHLIKDDTKDTAHLIKEDWDGSHNG